jgi:hypothetical protein
VRSGGENAHRPGDLCGGPHVAQLLDDAETGASSAATHADERLRVVAQVV